MANSMIPAGDFRTTYAADTTIFPTVTSRNFAIAGVMLACLSPYVLNEYWLSLLIQIGIYGIAALGLNVLVGFTGQISIGHAAFMSVGKTRPLVPTKVAMPRTAAQARSASAPKPSSAGRSAASAAP